MNLAIDRDGICKAVYAGFAKPAGVPIYSLGIEKYSYPYDPEAAKRLLKMRVILMVSVSRLYQVRDQEFRKHHGL